MSDLKITVEGLEDAVSSIVSDFLTKEDKNIKSAVQKASKKTAETLKTTSPKQTGKYKTGWKYRTEDDGYSGYSGRVYNSAKPSLTHLLEFGHGGPQPASAHPHIAPAYSQGKDIFLKELKKK